VSTLTVYTGAQSSTPIDRQSSGSMVLLGPARRFAAAASGWKFVAPLPVRFQREEDGTLFAVDQYFGNYGQGRTWDEAIEDLAVVLIEYYALMEAAPGAPSRSVFEDLRAYLQPVA